MKISVSGFAMALANICLVSTLTLRAQASDEIVIHDPAEYSAYENFVGQFSCAQQSAAGESFLQKYPQSVMKRFVLNGMIDCYIQLNQTDKALGAVTRLLEVDPDSLETAFDVAYVKKAQCDQSVQKSTGLSPEPQACAAAASTAQKELSVPKPANDNDAYWKYLTAKAYPVFHSAIALDAVSKKDFKGAEDEYAKELNLYSLADCSKPSPCLADTLQLAQAYSEPGDGRDEINAVWFYARAWDYAPANFKAQIEPQLDYWYKHYHGTLDGDAAITQQINDIKEQAQASLFPPANFSIAPALSPQQLADADFDNRLAAAVALVKAGRLTEAESAAAALVQSDPNRWEGYGLEGSIDESENKLIAAKAAYQQALELAPADVKAQLQQKLGNIQPGANQ